MAMSLKQKKKLEIALGNKAAADAIALEIDSSSTLMQAATVAALGALTAVPGTLGVAAAKADLDLVQAKLDAVIAALKAAGLMA